MARDFSLSNAHLKTTSQRGEHLDRLRIAHFALAGTFVSKIMVHDLRRLRPASDATVIAPADPELDEIRAEGFRVLTVRGHRKISPFLDLFTIWQVWRILRRDHFDLLHTYTPKAGLVGQIAGALAGVKNRIHSCRGLLYEPTMPFGRRWIFRITDRITNALASRVIYISRADLDFSIREGLCSPSKARFTGSGIDLRDYCAERFTPADRRETRRRLQIRDDAILVLTVGRFVREKGYIELGRAIPAIVNKYPTARFLWVAPVLDGEEATLPDDFLAKNSLTASVTRVGLQAVMTGIYAASDLLVHPSHREGVPRVIMEAAAMGVPVVTTNIPGSREILSDKDAFFCNPNDAESLRRAIDMALEDPVRAQSRALTASQKVRSTFDQDRLTERVWTVYEELLRSTAAVQDSP